MKMKWLPCFLVMFLPGGASAIDWHDISPPVDNVRIYVDLDSIRHNGSTARAWTLADHAEPLTVNDAGRVKTFQSVKELTVVNCDENGSGELSYISYAGPMGTGPVIKVINVPAAELVLAYPPPGSWGYKEIRFICDYKK